MYEQQLQQGLFSGTAEKTFSDKVLGKDDVQAVREIIKKERLSRTELTDLLNLLSSSEMKLLNYDERDRHVMAKFFVWIRDFVAYIEQLMDYKEDLIRRQGICECGGWMNDKGKPADLEKCTCKDPKASFRITIRTWQMFENNLRLMEHNLKFLVDLYFNLARTTLSIDAAAFKDLLTSRFEMSYPQGNQMSAGMMPIQQSGIGGLFRGGRMQK